MRCSSILVACTFFCFLVCSCATIVPGWIQSETYGKGMLAYRSSFFLREPEVERSVDARTLERELAVLLPLELGRLGFSVVPEESAADYSVAVYGYEREYFRGYAGKRSIKLEIEFFLPGAARSFLSAHAWSDGSGNLLETGVLRNLVLRLAKCIAGKTTGRKP